MSHHEKFNTTPMMQKCSYSSLAQTYNSSAGGSVTSSAKPNAGVQVVPEWGSYSSGYSSLVLPGPKSCTGYGTMANAYCRGGDGNAKFVNRSCH